MLAAIVLPLLLVPAWAADFAPVCDDDPSIQIVKEVITKANYYFEDHLLTQLRLPNIGGYLPTDIVTLTDGTIGPFNTITLQGQPDLQKRQNSDGSTTYLFDVKLGLEQLRILYQFHVSIIGLIKREGTVELTPERNSVGVRGIVVVKKDGRCDSSLYGIAVDKFEEFKILIQPNDIPGLSSISQIILNFVSPRVLPVTNLALDGVVFSPSFQRSFSDFVCKVVNQTAEVPTTEPPTEEPTTDSPTEDPITDSTTEDSITDSPTETTKRHHRTTETPTDESSSYTTEDDDDYRRITPLFSFKNAF